jgi:excisionase family DNA binding protein
MQKADDVTAQAALDAGRLAYPINAFAKALGVGRSKIYEEIRDGRLQAKKLGSRTLITAQAASDYLSRLPDIDAAKAA